ncbi:hypothetical protein [Pseudoalteromonas denitrificans]|uniref:Uncharacterized protein n=1 Tax=Pseudoalteromonas denitrificans DSM 6059 TaxID=1123010 RepID=A0A1I1MY71_9GAMM|nr:hypothetical protein [Pseudoalteromonas denitrificans]SFC90105.1 hypothetical protein SAMN02745724_02865 [Pseudoalteromonas denitrificans DSM 6059]
MPINTKQIPEVSSFEDIKIQQAIVKKNKAAVMAKINLQGRMSQGFRLVNNQAYEQKLQKLRLKIANYQYKNESNKHQDESMLSIMTTKGAITHYLDSNTNKKLNNKELDFKARNQIANTQLKRKQLFVMFQNTCEAQEELKEYAVQISSVCNGIVKQPPGAYFGVKDFHGALDKITNRKRNYDIGDLKDAARMTIIFDNMEDMVAAKSMISLTKEFSELQHFQSAMKDRYGTGKGAHSKYNCGATDAGYKDIKFFLKMSNGHIGELQLNTKNMMVAKKNGHIIYDVLRDGGALNKPFTITNKEVIAKVLKNMSEKWFDFVKTRVPKAQLELTEVKKIVKRLNDNVERGNQTLTVSLDEIKSLSAVSLLIYEQGDNARVLLD